MLLKLVMKSTRISQSLNCSIGLKNPKSQIMFYKKNRLHDFLRRTLTMPFAENFIKMAMKSFKNFTNSKLLNRPKLIQILDYVS